MTPFIDFGYKEDLKIEYFGAMSSEDSVKKFAAELENNWRAQCEQDPTSKRALLWAFLTTFRTECILILVVKLALFLPDLADPLLLKSFTRMIEDEKSS